MPGPVTPIEDLPDARDSRPDGNCEQAAQGQKNPLLPWRGGAEARDNSLDARTKALLDALEAEKRAREAGDQQKPQPQVPPPVVELPPVVEAPVVDEPKAGIVIACVVGALLVGVVVFYVVQKN
jgi:hypothetical protein